MRKFSLFLWLGMMFFFPAFVSAQTNAGIAAMTVQFWPEYDQPSMLVITDFELSPSTALPVGMTFKLPQDANLIAVANLAADGSLINAPFEGPVEEGDGQVFTLTVDQKSVYRFEYYQPLTYNGDQRLFSYLWDGGYAVDTFKVRVLEPLDVTSFTAEPSLVSAVREDGYTTHDSAEFQLAEGQSFTLNLSYEKSTDALNSPPQGIQPAAPVDENTTGRVSLNNSLPYLIGGFGAALMIGGVVYYWRAGKKPAKSSRRRTRPQTEGGSGDEAYCPQCGSRAKAGDRFCRVCGARLKNQA